MSLTRRRLLQVGAAAGAGVLLPARFTQAAMGLVPGRITPFTEQLPTLADLGVLDMTGGGSATLEMVNGKHRFHSAMGLTDTFTYQVPAVSTQKYLGPVIVAKQDTAFDLRVYNNLATHPLAFAVDTALVPDGVDDVNFPRAATHLHGGNTETHSDGGPFDTSFPGGFWDYHYGNTQEAAGLWYHDHALGITRLNVYAGLVSGYLIRNGDDPGDGTSRLPIPPYEVPMIIQDRMFNADGTFAYPSNPFTDRPWAPEFFGDVATVNGKAWPNLDVDSGKYRFRVYNGSNARFYNLKIVDARGHALTFSQIGSDGGLLDAPVKLNKLLLGPGERADMVVDFSGLPQGTVLTLTNNATTPFPFGPRALRRGGAPLAQIMQFTVTGQSGFTAPLPARLRTSPITQLADARFTGPNPSFPVAARRTMTLVEILDPVEGPEMALLNNRTLDSTDYQTAPVGANTLEQWELVNLTGDAHPIHLHFTQFQVLNRQRINAVAYQTAVYGADELAPGVGTYYGDGVQPYPSQVNPPVDPFLIGRPTPPPANEQGWKDTVVAMPDEVTRLLVPFGAQAAGGAPLAFSASHTGTYVWHCHILEHEDNDMMQRYTIV